MDRGSSKHGPRLDEQMEQEVRSHTQGSPAGSRADEAREPEPSAEGEPGRSPVGRPTADPPLVMTEEDVEGRSQLGRYLRRSVFPAEREALLAAAREANAPDDVVEQLERLPAGIRYATIARVWSALGHPMDERF